MTVPYECETRTNCCLEPNWAVTIRLTSSHRASRLSAACVRRNETGMISIAIMPTWSSGLVDSTPFVELSSLKKLVYGYNPMPIP